jgi:hypothetical protein
MYVRFAIYPRPRDTWRDPAALGALDRGPLAAPPCRERPLVVGPATASMEFQPD